MRGNKGGTCFINEEEFQFQTILKVAVNNHLAVLSSLIHSVVITFERLASKWLRNYCHSSSCPLWIQPTMIWNTATVGAEVAKMYERTCRMF